MFQISDFEVFLETFNSLLGVKYTKVNARFSSEWSGSTDVSSKDINIGIKGTELTRKSRAIAEAIDLHEIGHLLYTSPTLYADLSVFYPIDKNILNAFEDIRIETLFAEKHASLGYILPLNLINVIQDSNRENTTYVQTRLMALLIYGRYLYGDLRAREKLEPFIQRLSKIVKTNDLEGYITDYISYINNGQFREAAHLLMEFQKSLETQDHKEPQEKQSNSRVSNTDESPSQGEGNPVTEMESVVSKVKEDLETAIETLAGSVQAEEVLSSSFIEISHPIHTVFKSAISPKWRKLLRVLDFEIEGKSTVYARKGRKLSQRHIYKTINKQYIFKRKIPKLSGTGKVLFLVDLSGSMDSVASDIQEMVWTVTEVLENKHNFEVAWIYFSLFDRSYIIKDYGEKMPRPTSFNAHSSATVMTDALIMKHILPRADVEIIISDGLFHDLEEMSRNSRVKDSILLYIPLYKDMVVTDDLKKLFKSVIIINRTPESVIKGFKQIERFFL